MLLGLINGAFYALLSLGLAIIFGMLNIINFAHGALFMVGAFVAWMLQNYLGIDYWWALLIIAPVVVGIIRGAAGKDRDQPAVQHRPPVRPAADVRPGVDPGGAVPQRIRQLRPAVPDPGELLSGGTNLGFMFMPNYRAWVVVVAFVDVPGDLADHREDLDRREACAPPPRTRGWCRPSALTCRCMITLTYAAGVALAAFAGVLAAPIYSVNPNMGSPTSSSWCSPWW